MNEKYYITIGRIISSWGVKGQVKVEPLTDFPERFKKLERVFINLKGEFVCCKIESITLLKDYFPIIKFNEVDSKDKADDLRGCFIAVRREDAVKLPEGRFFICDIIGLRVFDETSETYIGTVKDVLQTGANDVFIVETDVKSEILVPAIKQVVKKIDFENGIISIEPLEGMF